MTPSLRSSFAALLVGLCLVVVAAGCSSESGSGKASASAVDDGKVSVQEPTVDKPANPSVAAVRMVIHNGTGTDDRLISVASPVARSVTVHRSVTSADGLSTMVEQQNLAIPARSSVTFEPGGLHVMLSGITKDLQIGDDVPLTLDFEHAGKVAATARVVEPGSTPEGSHDH